MDPDFFVVEATRKTGTLSRAAMNNEVIKLANNTM
jgi:hypothetical protein